MKTIVRLISSPMLQHKSFYAEMVAITCVIDRKRQPIDPFLFADPLVRFFFSSQDATALFQSPVRVWDTGIKRRVSSYKFVSFDLI